MGVTIENSSHACAAASVACAQVKGREHGEILDEDRAAHWLTVKSDRLGHPAPREVLTAASGSMNRVAHVTSFAHFEAKSRLWHAWGGEGGRDHH